jgi:hypothetical protein
MCAVDALVGVNFIYEHEFRTAVRPHADTEETCESRRGQSLVKHLRGCKKDIWGFGEHPFARKANLIRFDLLAAATIGTQ